jgi:HEAT repeat protein
VTSRPRTPPPGAVRHDVPHERGAVGSGARRPGRLTGGPVGVSGGGLRLRVFLSSPADVVQERAAASRIVEDLRYDPLLRGRVSVELVSWDRTGTTMLASTTPQQSVDAGLPLPSACDIVVVVLWKRIGTPLPPPYARPDGRPYESGTIWEFEDALRAAAAGGRPDVLLYRGRMPAAVELGAADLNEQQRQWRAVEDFFAGLRDGPTGAVRTAYTPYRSLEEFRTVLTRDLRELTGRRLGEAGPPDPVGAQAAAPLWAGSPFPGLRPFTPVDAPVYFGRGRESDELVALVRGSRFVAVVGASGSGKSSLVGAGLLPRLADLPAAPVVPSYDPGTGQWVGLRFTPGELGPNPFLALAVKLAPQLRRPASVLAGELAAAPERAGALLAAVPAGGRDVLVVVDQFEELFTATDPVECGRFVALLGALAEPPGRVVLTLRADFYHRCVQIPELARLLAGGQLPLSTPDDTLVEMIGRPADRAGLDFEEGLPGRIAHDAGREPGALPLLAYALDELHRRRAGNRLTHAAYTDLGGVAGAIGQRADAVFDALDPDVRAAFGAVFQELISVDRYGQLARRRAPLAAATAEPAAARLVEVLTDARLLVTDRSLSGRALVYVAHEALFDSWRRLREWAATRRDDLRLLDQIRAAAADWDAHGRSPAYLWPHERLLVAEEVVTRLRPDLDEAAAAFLRPEHERLFPVLLAPGTEDYRRQAIADRLVEIGAAVIPDLLDALGSDVPGVAALAGTTLVRLGPAAVPGLLDALYDPFAGVRLAALAALRQVADPRAVPRVALTLRDSDARVRAMAIGVLDAIGDPGASDAVGGALDDADVDVRWRAAGALGAFGLPAVRPLLRAMRDDSMRVRAVARDAIAVLGGDSLDTLVAAMSDPAAAVRVSAAEALRAIGEPAADAVLELATSEDPDIRWRALHLLDQSERLRGWWATYGRETDPMVQQAALTGLPAADRTLASGSLHDPEADVRWTAAAVAAAGPLAAVELLETLRLSRGRVAVAVAQALVRAGKVVLPGDFAEWRPRWRRLLVADVLAAGGRAGAEWLIAALGDPDPEVRRVAAGTVAAVEEDTRAWVLTVLRFRLDDAVQDPAGARDPAAWAAEEGFGLALGATVWPWGLDTLGALLDREPPVAWAAAAGLARHGEAGVALLVAALDGPDGHRQEAVSAGLLAAGPAAVAPLLRVAAGAGGPRRDRAIGILTAISTAPALFGLAELGVRPART